MIRPKPSKSGSRSAVFSLPGKSSTSLGTPRDTRVGQDKSAPLRDRAASLQPAADKKPARSHGMSTSPPRSQKRSRKRQTVPITLWIAPKERAELERLAAQEGLSLSLTARTLLQEALRQKLHIQHAVLLEQIIRESIRKEMQGLSTRLALLLVRVAFNTGQTRHLVTNILGRQPPRLTEKELNNILDTSAKAANKDILRRSASLAPIIAKVERLLQEENNES